MILTGMPTSEDSDTHALRNQKNTEHFSCKRPGVIGSF